MKPSHGFTGSKIYRIWKNMLARCTNPHNKHFMNYGGRGIIVCERWRKFENFFADMGFPPKGMMLDRIDNNKSYDKFNCRWATSKQQALNKRTNRLIEIDGVVKTAKEWADSLGICPSTIRNRLHRGWNA